jgi:DNA repair protein RadC
MVSMPKQCAILPDIAVLDHIIVGNEQYYSYADDESL